MQYLHQRVCRELTRSPKKTLALLLVSLVAVYVWFPLIWKTPVGGEQATQRVTTIPLQSEIGLLSSEISEADALEEGNAEDRKFEIDWSLLLGELDAEPFMKPVRITAAMRNPFSFSTSQEKEMKFREQSELDGRIAREEAAAIRPEDLGLALNSTVVSSRGRSARISGRVYREQAVIRVRHENDETGLPFVEFRLVHVGSRHVILERTGEQFKLAIPKPAVDTVGLLIAPSGVARSD